MRLIEKHRRSNGKRTRDQRAKAKNRTKKNKERQRLIPLDAFFMGVGSVEYRVFHVQNFPCDDPVFPVVHMTL